MRNVSASTNTSDWCPKAQMRAVRMDRASGLAAKTKAALVARHVEDEAQPAVTAYEVRIASLARRACRSRFLATSGKAWGIKRHCSPTPLTKSTAAMAKRSTTDL